MKTTNVKTPLFWRDWGWLYLMLAFLGLSTANAQVAIGTDDPHQSAMLDLESTEKGFLPPRMNSEDRDAINLSSTATGLLIYNTDVKCLQVYDGAFWFDLCDGIADVPTVISANGVEWMDRNLGASQVATSSTDADSYGDMYQWGRATDGHEDRNSPNYGDVVNGVGVANFDNDPSNPWYGEFILRNSGDHNWVDPSVSGVDDLWQGVNGTNNPCPTGYRLPTEAEWEAERLSWSSNNAAGAFDSPLKLPMAGLRARANGSLILVGARGLYMSSTVSGSDASILFFDSSNAIMSALNRASGYSVRCLKD